MLMIDYKNITAMLRSDTDMKLNIELASEVVANRPRAVHYYLTEIGEPIMRHIENNIVHRNVTADYYLFLSKPFDSATDRPQWHKVSLYKGLDCRLATYTSCIACRHFCKVARQDKAREQRENPLVEYVDYEALLDCDCADASDSEYVQLMRQAMAALSERDREVLRCLVVDNMPSLEAYPQLERFITPRAKDGMSPDEVKARWTVKQRQDALALMKGRALKHLHERFEEIRKHTL